MANLRQRTVPAQTVSAAAGPHTSTEFLNYLSAMVESSDDAILAKTPEGVITYWNPGAERLYGYTAAEVIGKPVTVLIPARLQGEFHEILERIRRGEQMRHYETQRVTKDGRELDVSLTVSPIYDTLGTLLGASTIARDVTERKQAEQAVRYLSALVESSSDAIIGETLDGMITFWNRGAERVYGYHPGEMIGNSLSIVIPEERLPELTGTLERIRSGAGFEQFETIRRRKNGELFPAWITVSPICDVSGAIIGASVITRDISAHKRIERDLRDAKERADNALVQLRTTLDSLSEGVLVAGPNDEILLANPGFWQSYNLERDSLTSFAELLALVDKLDLTGTELPPSEWPLFMAMRGETVKQRELRVRRKGGSEEKILSQSAVPVLDASGLVKMAVLTVEDITERKDLQQRLHQAEKLEAIGQLAGGIAHDMNNYLGCILLQAGLMRMRLGSNQEMVGYCAEIESVCDQARSVVRQLLAFGRRSFGMRIVVDVNQSVSATLAMLRRLIGSSVHIEWKLEEPGWAVRTNPGSLSAILMNLAVNARDAMPDGGKLSITTRNTVLQDTLTMPDIVIDPGEYIVLSVSDSGTGISSEHLAKIFEPFFTTKPVGSGTGLGLSTVYGAVKEMGGHVHIKTKLGVGTTFDVWLPRCVEGQTQDAPGKIPAPRARAGALLVVEDEPIVRQAMIHYLKSSRYNVTAVCSGLEALELVRADPARFRTVLTDLVMPGMSGRVLARSLLQEVPEMRIILMSGYDREESTSDLDERVEFLAKPFEIRELASMLGDPETPSPQNA